jgi:hypothetical protein
MELHTVCFRGNYWRNEIFFCLLFLSVNLSVIIFFYYQQIYRWIKNYWQKIHWRRLSIGDLIGNFFNVKSYGSMHPISLVETSCVFHELGLQETCFLTWRNRLSNLYLFPNLSFLGHLKADSERTIVWSAHRNNPAQRGSRECSSTDGQLVLDDKQPRMTAM